MNLKHIPILVGATMLFGAAHAFTQEVALPGRALQKTSMKTQNTLLGLNSTFKDAFTPTMFPVRLQAPARSTSRCPRSSSP